MSAEHPGGDGGDGSGNGDGGDSGDGRDNGNDGTDAWLLGVDAGLTSIKAALVAPDGTEQAVATAETPKTSPRPDHHEVDPGTLWSTVAETIGRAVEKVPVSAEAIAAVGVAGHGHGLYALDDDGEPAGPGIRSTDGRARELLAAWRADGTADRIRDRLGYAPFGADPLSLLAWLRDNEPARYDRIDTILFCKDYLTYRLTGRCSTDEMESSVFTDPRTGEYATDLLEEIGLGAVADALPPVDRSWESCGTITERAAAATGLPAGTPVATGLHDVGAVALGTGTHTPGDGVLIVGTWGQSIVIDDGPSEHDDEAIDDGEESDPADDPADHDDESDDRAAPAHGITREFLDGKRLRYEGNRSAAASLEWFVGAFGEPWREAAAERGLDEYAMYDRLVSAVPPGADGVVFHPYLHGSTADPNATGGFFGLTADHDADHLLRAVYEGVAIAGIEQLSRVAPAGGIDDLRLSGGGARSDAWARIFAGVADRPVVVPGTEEAGITGAAICAALAADIHSDHAAAVDAMVPAGTRYDPEPEAAAVYRRRRRTFRQLRDALAPIWNATASSDDGG